MAKKKKRGDDVKLKKKKTRAVVEDDFDDDDDEIVDLDVPKKPRSNVYVGLGALTLLAFVAAAVFLYLDADANSKKTPQAASIAAGELKLGGRNAPGQ